MDNKDNKKAEAPKIEADAPKPAEVKKPGGSPGFNKPGVGGNRSVYGARKKEFKRKRKFDKNKKQDDFEQRVVDIARVTRVMAGGKRMRFRACVAVGDKKGQIGVGLGKGSDVTIAVTKAVNKAKRNMINVVIVNDTIPHEVYIKHGAAKILLKPARRGKGVIAGGAVRIILELAGIKNISSKILGTNNKINIAEGTIEALKRLLDVGKTIEKRAKKKVEKPIEKPTEEK